MKFYATFFCICALLIGGGSVWTNISGNRGAANWALGLSTDDWQQEPYTSPEYVLAVDAIKYNWELDQIVGRREEKGNNEVYAKNSYDFQYNVHPIRYFQWGNPYSDSTGTGIGNQRIVNSTNHNSNFKGSYQTNIVMENRSYLDASNCFEGSRQSNLTLTRESMMSNFSLFNSSQNNLSLSNGTMNYFTLTNASQDYATLINSKEFNFYVDSAQSNSSLWNREWNRKNVVVQEDENIFKFPFQIQKKAQTETRIMNIPFSTSPYSGIQYIYDLTFQMQDSMDYTFEYDLLVHNFMSGNKMIFDFNIPWVEDKYIKFSFHNLSTGQITHSVVNSGTGTASVNVSAPGYFKVNITGCLKNPPGYALAFIIQPQTLHPSGFTVEKGSHATFVKTPHSAAP